MLRTNAILATMMLLMLAIAPATQPDLSTPENAVRAYYHALFDGDWAARDAVSVNNDASSAWLKATQHSIASAKRFSDAVGDKFGDAAATRFVAKSRDIIMKALPDAKATIDGDKATVLIPVSPTSKQMLHALKVQDVWKYDPRDANSSRQAEMARDTAKRSAKVEALAARVDAGEFKSADDLYAVYRQMMITSARSSSTTKSSENSK